MIRLSGLAPDAEDRGFRFVLHAGLEPEVVGRDWRLYRLEEESPAAFLGINATSETAGRELPLEVWRLVPDEFAAESVVLRYGGEINHPLATSGEEYQRSFSETPGSDRRTGGVPGRRELLGPHLRRPADDLRARGRMD